MDSESLQGLTWNADQVLAGEKGLDSQGASRALGETAAAIARALRRNEARADTELDGPSLSQNEADLVATEARYFLELIAVLFGAEAYAGAGDDYAFQGRLAKRQGWKPPAKRSPGEMRRAYAASRVYELMAQQAWATKQPPKQTAAVHQVVAETGLPRSKVMQGLKEQREQLAVWCSVSPEGQPIGAAEAMARARAMLAGAAMSRNGPSEAPE